MERRTIERWALNTNVKKDQEEYGEKARELHASEGTPERKRNRERWGDVERRKEVKKASVGRVR